MTLPEIKLSLTVNEVRALLSLLYVLDEAGEKLGITKDESLVPGIGEKLIQGVINTESDEIMTILPEGFEVEMWKKDGKIH